MLSFVNVLITLEEVQAIQDSEGNSAKLIKICMRLCSSCNCKAILAEMCYPEVKNTEGKPRVPAVLGVHSAKCL